MWLRKNEQTRNTTGVITNIRIRTIEDTQSNPRTKINNTAISAIQIKEKGRRMEKNNFFIYRAPV